MSRRGNPIDGWRVDAASLRFVGHGLQRPACLLAEPDGTLWASDLRGATRLAADGGQAVVYQVGCEDPALGEKPLTLGNSLPNGLALDRRGRLVVANIGTGAIEAMWRDGRSRTLLDTLDGRPLGRPVSVLCDTRGRLWFTATRSLKPWLCTINDRAPDGYVAVVDERGARIVADGLVGVGELRFDAREEWLHVAESTARRVQRLRIGADAACLAREVFGPADLGGMPSGLAFDAFGNLWMTLVMAERLVALTPQGELRVLLDDGDAVALQAFDDHAQDGSLTPGAMAACRGSVAPWMAGIAFGGADLSVVHLGSLTGQALPGFVAPVRGLPLPHWRR